MTLHKQELCDCDLRPSWRLPSALSKICVSIVIYFCINICFCIKQVNKICTLLSSHLLALIVFSVRCFCFKRVILFWSPDKPDKGSGVVVMDKSEYIHLLSEASVNDTSKFRPISSKRPITRCRPPKHYHSLLAKEVLSSFCTSTNNYILHNC